MATMDTGWVLFTLQKQQFGMPIKDLLQMVVLDKVATQATAPETVRGLINLRNRIVPVVDTRQCLGMTTKLSQQNEFVQMMNARKQDHIHWLDELFLAIEEKRTFTLTRDPHLCAFGKWYDGYKTDNAVFGMHLAKFDAPHRRIHQLADEVDILVSRHELDKAQKLIEKTRDNELKTMITLFDSVETVLKEAEKEIVLIMNRGNHLMGFVVDDVYTVKDIQPDNIQMVDQVHSICMDGGTRVAEVDGVTSILLHPDDVFRTTSSLLDTASE
ncbi:MAG: chemotaxis protein CheW [Deltaproteobacteria bacterium]|nr:chemotaxis protein CheW [Deltaproteobacteria bacterium]